MSYTEALQKWASIAKAPSGSTIRGYIKTKLWQGYKAGKSASGRVTWRKRESWPKDGMWRGKSRRQRKKTSKGITYGPVIPGRKRLRRNARAKIGPLKQNMEF